MIEASLRALTDDLFDAIALGRWGEADAKLETLVQEALSSILQDRIADLAIIARLITRCHSSLALRDGLSPEAMHRLGQLRAITVLTSAGLNRQSPRPPATPAETETETATASLLAALRQEAKTGQSLASATGLKPDVVARALPELRAAGLIRSWPAGRLVMNALTEAGRKLAETGR